jgi:hypothetical protein
MYFEDLSPYTYCLPRNVPEGANLGGLETALNVGWLENGYPFDVGPTPWKFRSKLHKLAKDIKNPMWGFHECDLCDGSGRKPQGNGEIHVIGSDGIIYVAPELIVHYLGTHKYLPPQKFIDAVMTNGR